MGSKRSYSDTEVSSYSSTPDEDDVSHTSSDTSSCADECISDSETELSLERTDNVCQVIVKSGKNEGKMYQRKKCNRRTREMV